MEVCSRGKGGGVQGEVVGVHRWSMKASSPVNLRTHGGWLGLPLYRSLKRNIKIIKKKKEKKRFLKVENVAVDKGFHVGCPSRRWGWGPPAPSFVQLQFTWSWITTISRLKRKMLSPTRRRLLCFINTAENVLPLSCDPLSSVCLGWPGLHL